MDIDRAADLHYAYQFGQDAARGDYAAALREFTLKFGDDSAAALEFAAGYRDEAARRACRQ